MRAMWGCSLLCAACAGEVAERSAADVIGARASGEPGAYTVFVEIRSDETGCGRYADWWELVTPGGDLVYRRILDHSHPDEQPFERSGGPVAVSGGDELVVRAHLHDDAAQGDGYGGAALRGTFDGGFEAWEAPSGFGIELATAAPQPDGCLF